MRRRTLAALLLAAPLALGCRDATAPVREGTYVLQRVVADPLPAVVRTIEGHGEVLVGGHTLRLEGGGRGSGVQVYGWRHADGRVEAPEPRPVTFGYRRVGPRIEVEFDCPPLALCAGPPHLVLRPVADGLEAEYALGERVPQRYRLAPTP